MTTETKNIQVSFATGHKVLISEGTPNIGEEGPIIFIDLINQNGFCISDFKMMDTTVKALHDITTPADSITISKEEYNRLVADAQNWEESITDFGEGE